ncbi:MAG: type III pantothenate kinase [Bacteroides sp.]|nr:type III pantothenate kinase [Roseburia sp.]MCM1462522.1 type III pantothenate kinase [Bacteroides sp.]
MYILTIDVGNTNTVFGAYDRDDALKFEARVETSAARMADEYVLILMNLLNLNGVKADEIEGAVLSSVVPPATGQIGAAVDKLLGLTATVIGPGLKTGLNIRLDDPSSLGADLCCAAVAAKELYPLPAIVVDLGTATKLLAISGRGEFLGGAIAGGLKMTFESLASGTAALPLISAGKVEKAIGTNTIDCMRSGVILGMAETLDGLIDRFEKEMGAAASIVATGGFSAVVMSECRHKMIHDPQLILKGMLAIYRKNRG